MKASDSEQELSMILNNLNLPIDRKKRMLKRMDEIIYFWKRKTGVRAVAAFGSLAELNRFDEWSDLDFLVVSTVESKMVLLNQINYFDEIYPVTYKQTEFGDAVKLLFEDDILCDFGIVTEKQVREFPHGKGRILWCEPDFPADCIEANEATEEMEDLLDWKGNILIHIYVGLLRLKRGEIAAAFEEIQIISVQKLLKHNYKEKGFAKQDSFAPLRRAEIFASENNFDLSKLLPGYLNNKESAEEILRSLKNGVYPVALMLQVEKLLHEIKEETIISIIDS